MTDPGADLDDGQGIAARQDGEGAGGLPTDADDAVEQGDDAFEGDGRLPLVALAIEDATGEACRVYLPPHAVVELGDWLIGAHVIAHRHHRHDSRRQDAAATRQRGGHDRLAEWEVEGEQGSWHSSLPLYPKRLAPEGDAARALRGIFG